MKGFFTGKKVRKRTALEADPCNECGLFKGCKSPQMPVSGRGYKKILIIAEAPGAEEDEENTQLIGAAGQLLEDYLDDQAGIDLHADCWKINAVNCRPPKNRKPTPREIECCRTFMVDAIIKELKPKFIIPAGGAAVESLFKPMFSNCSIGRWRGLLIPDPRYKAWVMPILHPSYIGRQSTNRHVTSVFERDLRRVGANVKRKKHRPKIRDFGSNVTIASDFDEVVEALEELLAQGRCFIFFDYEATSLKPFGFDQRIWSVSFSYSPNDAFAFPLRYPHWTEEQHDVIHNLWRKVLRSRHIQKIAQNAKFEDMWSRVIFDIPKVAGWHWCTATTAHNLDVRQGNAGLKFLLFKHFGTVPYDTDVKKHIAPKGKSTINTLDRVPLPKLLKYNGIDTAGGFAVYEKQRMLVRGRLKEANKLTFMGSISLSDAQITGISIDELYFVEQRETLTQKIDMLETRMLNGPVAKKFKKKTGRKLQIKNKDFSATDLRAVFFDVLNFKPTKLTGKSQQAAVDKEVLGDINHQFARDVIERRKLCKMRDTYIASIMREVVDGRINPFYDLTTTRTHRSSSSLPNFQNIPNREEEDRKLIRCGIKPLPGMKIGAVDYGSIEVRILACCTRDPVLMEYIFDETTDMHRDEAKKIFVVSEDWIEKKLLKILRSWIKNQWVFPQFYGSYFVTCAKAIWDLCFDLLVSEGITVRDHLIEEGVIDRNPRRKTKIMRGRQKIVVPLQYAQWEAHIKDIEDDFWDKYHVSREWQQKQESFYIKKGYVELLTGHRREEILDRNKIYNTPVQGTAFQCLLWSYNKLTKIKQKERWTSSLMGQIHDEILFNVDPAEEGHLLRTTERVMCHDIREHWDWIIVPLVIEPELTPVDAAWYYKKEVEIPMEPTDERRRKFKRRKRISR